jgi:uncharacterized caspase-like protein
VALVIGNDAYQAMPRLKNPVRDASEVEATLRRLGFVTTKLINADARALNDGLKRFAQGAAGAEAIFVFYSGHGAQLEGRTWLLPVDAHLETKEDINDADLLALDRILATLRDKSAVRIVVLDACRDNPVVDALNLKIAEAQGFKGAGLSKGLGRPLTALGDLVVYATQAGAVAADGNGTNSPFTESLLKHLETTDLDVRQMFFRVQEDVGRRYKQLPEVSNSIIGEFKLKSASLTDEPPGTQPTTVSLSRELSLWVNDKIVERYALASELNAATSGNKKTHIYLRADRSVSYQEVMRLLALIQAEGYRVSLVTEAESSK